MYSFKVQEYFHTTESYGFDLIGYKVEKPLNNGHLKIITNSRSSNRCEPNQTEPNQTKPNQIYGPMVTLLYLFFKMQ